MLSRRRERLGGQGRNALLSFGDDRSVLFAWQAFRTTLDGPGIRGHGGLVNSARSHRFEYAGYADIVLSFYFLASAGFLYSWWRGFERVDLAGAALAAAAAAWTKNEGQLFLVAVVLLAAARLLNRREGLKSWLLLLGPPAAVMVTWTLLRLSFRIESAGSSLLTNFHPDLFSTALAALVGRVFEWSEFQFSAPLLLAVVAAGIILRAQPALWIPVFLVAWQIGGALLAYASGANDLAWWLGTFGRSRSLPAHPARPASPRCCCSPAWAERLEPGAPAD